MSDVLYARDAPVLPPPAPISIEDLMNTVEVMVQKEADDKAALERMGAVTADQLRPSLVEWAIAKFPDFYEIYRITIVPPQKCSDGAIRQMAQYIEFCSGKPFEYYVDRIREKVTGIKIDFSNKGGYLAILASRV